MEAKRKLVGCKLRPGLDNDIAEALSRVSPNGVSELVRYGLRVALGLATEKVVEVRERQLKPPIEFLKNMRER